MNRGQCSCGGYDHCLVERDHPVVVEGISGTHRALRTIQIDGQAVVEVSYCDSPWLTLLVPAKRVRHRQPFFAQPAPTRSESGMGVAFVLDVAALAFFFGVVGWAAARLFFGDAS